VFHEYSDYLNADDKLCKAQLVLTILSIFCQKLLNGSLQKMMMKILIASSCWRTVAEAT